MPFYIIAAYDLNRLIGINNQLPWHLPNDLRHFRAKTLHETVVMGRKTFESIGKPLQWRENVVLSSSKLNHNVKTIHSLAELQDLARDDDDEIFIIGGEQLYNATLPLASQLYITEIHHAFSVKPTDSAAYFPQFDKSEWCEVSREYLEADDENQYPHSIVELIRK